MESYLSGQFFHRGAGTISDDMAWHARAAYATGKGLHLAIDILPSKLTGRSAHRLRTFLNLVVVAFAFAAMVVGARDLCT